MQLLTVMVTIVAGSSQQLPARSYDSPASSSTAAMAAAGDSQSSMPACLLSCLLCRMLSQLPASTLQHLVWTSTSVVLAAQ
jgi:hypothetical protein